MDDSKACVLCNSRDESSVHLFLHCEVASLVWFKLMWWLENFHYPPPPNLVKKFMVDFACYDLAIVESEERLYF